MTVGNEIIDQLKQIQQEALETLDDVLDEESLQNWRIANLGRSAPVMQAFSDLREAPKELRPKIGQLANQVKEAMEMAFTARQENLRQEGLQRSLKEHSLDVTMPGRRPERGRLHPTTLTLRRVLSVLADMGFQVYLSPEVETDANNFELLNIPQHHPARDMWDTFFTDDERVVLRTHTSPGQIHAMRQYAPEPVRVALPGMCYRYEQITARSEIQFNQVELLAVGTGITFADLKGTLTDFARRMFGEHVQTRFRPSYFPFTEPSAEMDVECFVCGGKGCQVCKGSGWLEILGCGMVHPVVLMNGGYDPEKYTGYAAGMGTERVCMLQQRIEDIRYFWSNDVRFLEQF